MTDVNWHALSREQQQALYPQLVHQVFGRNATPSGIEAQALLPPVLGAELVQIEITTYCNLRCRECGRTKAINEGTWVNRHLALADYESILEKLPSARKIFLQGVGEPSMHPHFEELVSAAAKSGKYQAICFNTNGLPHTDEFWIALARNHPSVAPSLSIDSLDPEIAERCRAGTDVELLYRRLNLFREIFPSFTVTLVASRMNLDDIPLTLARIGSLGPGFLGIQNVITEDVEVALSESDEVRLRAVIAAAGSACPQLKVNWGSRSSGLKRCVSPFLTPFVTIQGHLTPCCVLVDSTPFRETSLLGTENWDEIRSSENVMKWMRDYLVEDPEPCRGCTFNPARTEKTRQRTSL